MKYLSTHTDAQSGFTLVELAIVLMIIGLLIGGILKGQEMISNARVTSVIRQMQGYETAVTAFRDSYGAFPGDMLSPATRLPNCISAACIKSGNNNGTLGEIADGHPFIHLSKGNFITGFDEGMARPFLVSRSDAVIEFRGGPVFGFPLAFEVWKNDGYGGAASPHQAAQIDRKMDDGLPLTGGFVIINAYTDDGSDNYVCSTTPSTNVYAETETHPDACALFFRYGH